MPFNSTYIFAFLFASLVLPSRASAQDDFFGVNEEMESQEGLENATPTDSIDELNSGGAGNGFSEGNFGEGNFPAAEGNGNGAGFNLDTGDEGGSDDFFTNEPINNGNMGQGVSAFGGGQNSPQAAPVTNNVAPVANPLQQAIPQQAPVQTLVPQQVPVNAQNLMNQIDSIPVDSPANPGINSMLNPGSNATAEPATEPELSGEVAGATGEETLLPSNPELAIDAPPLPPPNEFAGSPPVPGTMRILAESEAPEEYLVQQGDTLFDICDQLLDEPAYWPKLWALNPEIKNPHFIFPNMKLRFYPGDDETPPYLQVVTEEEVIPIEKGDLDEEELIAEKVIFEEEEELEGSLGIEVIGTEEVEELSDQILVAGRAFQSDETTVQVPGFIYGEEREPDGFVVVGRDGGISKGPGAQIVIESNGGISNGTLYTVLRKGEEVRDPESNDFIGYKYYFVGNVRVKRKLEDEELYMGVVESNRLTVMAEDILVSFISTNRTVPLSPNVGSTNAIDSAVVGFDYNGQLMGGQGGFAFISKGSGDGVSPGMYIPLYSNPGYITYDIGSSNLPRDPEFVGVLRIIDTTDAGAVGYIVTNTKEIRIGDRTDKG